MITTQQRTPPRIAKRPDVSSWGRTDLITLPEAVALRWPDGPLTVKSLRNAIAKGRLGHVRIARKLFTTLDSLDEMCRCVTTAPAPPDPPPDAPAAPAPTEVAALLARMGMLGSRSARTPRA
jgi:hypothetical protein